MKKIYNIGRLLILVAVVATVMSGCASRMAEGKLIYSYQERETSENPGPPAWYLHVRDTKTHYVDVGSATKGRESLAFSVAHMQALHKIISRMPESRREMKFEYVPDGRGGMMLLQGIEVKGAQVTRRMTIEGSGVYTVYVMVTVPKDQR